MSDRRFGYILIVLSLLLAAGFVVTFFHVTSDMRETRTLRFPQVGSLSLEDPVRMEGTLVAEISSLEHDDSARVLVQIRSREVLPIRTSSDVAVKVKGVMGERFIEITSGNLNDPLVPPDVIIDGRFELGPSEAIAYMDRLEDKIIELRDIMLWLRDGRDDGRRPFIVAFDDIVNILDTVIFKTYTVFTDHEDRISAAVDTAAQLVDDVIRLTAMVSTKAPTLINDLNVMMEKVDKLANTVDTLITRIEPVIARLDTSNILWGDHADRVRRLLPEIQYYMNWVREEGLPLRLRLRVF